MKYALIFLLALVSIAAAAPSDYVKLLDNKCTSVYGPTISCYSVYNITNPTANPITIDTSNFKFKWRTQITDALLDQIGAVKNVKLERFNGASWVDLNLGASVTLQAKTSYIVRISAEKVWVPTGNGQEQQLMNVDNVLSAFGHDYTEYAWWNSTYLYKRPIVYNITNDLNSNLTLGYSADLSDLIAAGKLDTNATCYRFVNANETGELPFDYEPANANATNYSAFIFANFTSGGNQTIWAYYAALPGCPPGQGNIPSYWNKTGALAVLHFGNDFSNASSMADSAGFDENFTIIGTLPRVKSNMGYAFQRSSNGNNLLLNNTRPKFNNYPSGTVILWVNLTSTTNAEWVVRGNASAGGVYDFIIRAVGGVPGCSLDATANNAVDGLGALSVNRWYMIACSWNSTGLYMFRNGMMTGSDTSVPSKAGLPNNILNYQLTIGQGGPGFGNIFQGAISEVQIYNRSLSYNELEVLANSTGAYNGPEQGLTGTPPIITRTSPLNQTYLLSSPFLISLNVSADQAVTWIYQLNSSGINVSFTPNTTIAPGFGDNLLEIWVNNSNGTVRDFVYFNVTQFFLFNSTTISAFDALTSLPIYFNATISNGTYVLTTLNNLTYTNASLSFPQGLSSISFQNSSYYRTQADQTFSGLSSSVSVYLLPISDPFVIFVRFHVANTNGAALPGAEIVIYDGGNLIGSALTDSSGIASFYLDSTRTYSITASLAGFPTNSVSLMPVQNDYYFTLSSSGSTNFDFLFSNVSWSLTPDPRALYVNSSMINFTVTSLDAQLEWYGLALTYNQTLIFNQSNYTPSSGGVILVTVNLTGRSGQVFAHPYFKKLGFAEYYDNSAPFTIFGSQAKQYYNSSGNIGSFVSNKASLGIDDFGIALILLLLGFAITIILSRTIGIGAGVIGLVILAFLALFGIFSPLYSGSTPNDLSYWGIFSWIVLVIVGLIAMRYGGF